jgi:hypothetical protein
LERNEAVLQGIIDYKRISEIADIHQSINGEILCKLTNFDLEVPSFQQVTQQFHSRFRRHAKFQPDATI